MKIRKDKNDRSLYYKSRLRNKCVNVHTITVSKMSIKLISMLDNPKIHLSLDEKSAVASFSNENYICAIPNRNVNSNVQPISNYRKVIH